MKKASSLFVLVLLGGSGNAAAECEGCFWDDLFAPYTERIDQVRTSSGNAKAVNTVTHMITPWPPYVYDRRIPGNGPWMVNAIRNYQDKLKPEQSSAAPSMSQGLAAGVAAGVAGGMAAGNAMGANAGAEAGGSGTAQGGGASGQGGQTGQQ